MQEMLYIEEVEQAAALLKPRRLEILRCLGEPHSCLELAEFLQDTPQKIYYHIKALEQAALIEKVSERRVRSMVEGFYQAKALSYWLSPGLIGHLGTSQHTQGDANLRLLLSLAEQLQTEVGHLAQARDSETPSLGLTAQVELCTPQDRNAFLQDLQQSIQALALKYGKQGGQESGCDSPDMGQTFRLLLACYPTPPGRSLSPEISSHL